MIVSDSFFVGMWTGAFMGWLITSIVLYELQHRRQKKIHAREQKHCEEDRKEWGRTHPGWYD